MSTIRWSPVSAIIDKNNNMAPGTIVCGSPGSGKTFFMLNVAANCLGVGQNIVAIDPKNDFEKLYNVNHNVKVINISNAKPGAMNPFTFLKEYDDHGNVIHKLDTNTLMTIVEQLCGKLDKKDIIAITPIITDFITKSERHQDQYVDMQDVADYLCKNKSEEARAIGMQLNSYADSEHGKLLFTREKAVKPLEFNANDSMIISLHGMQLPDYNKKVENYDANDKLTATLIYLITTKLLHILSKKKRIPTTLFCDEAHLLFVNPTMASLIDRFLVLGRSLNNAVVLASQGISHFPEGIANYMTSRFLFKSSVDEAEKFLRLFDLSKVDPSQAIAFNSVLGMVSQFPRGYCYFIDRFNRNGVIEIKSIYDPSLLTSNPILQQEVVIKDDEDTKEE